MAVRSKRQIRGTVYDSNRVESSAADSFRTSVALIRKAREGDEIAFDDLLARYYPRVFRVVRRRLGADLRQHAESGDVVQEVMWQVVRTFDRFEVRDEEALIRWMGRVAENRIRDMAKFHGAARRAGGVPLAGDDGGAKEPASDRATPFEEASGQEQREAVDRAMAQLSPERRELLERRAKGASWKEIAEAMGLEAPWLARDRHASAMVALMRALPDDRDR